MSEYTAEEYRKVLMSIYDMDAEKRKKAFGVSTLVGGYVKDFSVSELIEKYRVYINTPKTGEYWKRKGDGKMVVVLHIENDVVFFYYCKGGADYITLTYFIDYFVRTEHKSRYLADFLNEMEEVSK